MSKRCPCTSVSANSMIARLLLIVILFSLVPSLLPAQTAATNPEVQALREEVSELKARLAGLESRLEAFSLTTSAPANAVVGAAPAGGPVAQASRESAPVAEQATPNPAPFAFGDFTWMNGQ